MQLDDNPEDEIEDGCGGTIKVALDQVQFEVDCSAQHGNDLCAALQPYIANARKVRATKTRRSSKGLRTSLDLA